MIKYALRAFGGPVFLSNMIVPIPKYALRAFGGPVFLSNAPSIPPSNITLYVREGNILLYERQE